MQTDTDGDIMWYLSLRFHGCVPLQHHHIQDAEQSQCLDTDANLQTGCAACIFALFKCHKPLNVD